MSGAFVKGDHVLPLVCIFSADLASMTSFLTAGVIDSIQTHYPMNKQHFLIKCIYLGRICRDFLSKVSHTFSQ